MTLIPCPRAPCKKGLCLLTANGYHGHNGDIKVMSATPLGVPGGVLKLIEASLRARARFHCI